MQLSGELMIMVPLPGGGSHHLRLGYKYLDTNAPETATYRYMYLDSGYKRQKALTIYIFKKMSHNFMIYFKHFILKNLCFKHLMF